MAKDHETAELTLGNGDKLSGTVKLKPVRLDTLFGDIRIGIAHIKRISVLLPGGQLSDQLRRSLVLYYSFDNDDAGTVKDLSLIHILFIIQIRINNKVIIRPWERIGMKKKLLEMTKEELRRLFPIFLVPHKKEWRDVFAEEKGVLTSFLKDIKLLRIEHIGSTAIPDIYAKDIVYVEEKDFVRAESILKENGYISVSYTHLDVYKRQEMLKAVHIF